MNIAQYTCSVCLTPIKHTTRYGNIPPFTVEYRNLFLDKVVAQFRRLHYSGTPFPESIAKITDFNIPGSSPGC